MTKKNVHLLRFGRDRDLACRTRRIFLGGLSVFLAHLLVRCVHREAINDGKLSSDYWESSFTFIQTTANLIAITQINAIDFVSLTTWLRSGTIQAVTHSQRLSLGDAVVLQ